MTREEADKIATEIIKKVKAAYFMPAKPPREKLRDEIAKALVAAWKTGQESR